MGMAIEGQVGQQFLGDGAQATMRQGRTAEQIITELQGRYYENVYRGNTFFACNQAAIVATAGLSTAAKVMTLYNPAGSGKNLVLLEILLSMTTLPVVSTTVATNVFLAGNVNPLQAAPSSVTAETVRNALLGGASGVGLVYNTCTLAATPVAIRPLASVDVLTTVGYAALVCKDEVAGALVIPPGIYVSIQASAATLALQCSVTWAEVLL
jgi:hypothetical protein